jgi:hypothetical protein
MEGSPEFQKHRCWNSVVNIVSEQLTGKSEISLLTVARGLFLIQIVQTRSGAHLASCSMNTRVSFHGGKAAWS